MENKTTVKSPNYDGISFGIFLLFAGAISLLVNTGIITWSWSNILTLLASYWPIFIILLGIKIVVETFPLGKFWGLVLDIVVYLLIIAALIYAPTVIMTSNNSVQVNGDSQIVSRTGFSGATQKDLHFTFGAADLTVFDSNNSDVSTLIGPQDKKGAYTIVNAKQNNSTVDVSFENRIENSGFLNIRKNYNVKYQVEVGAQDMLTNLYIKLGASKGVFDFDNTIIKVVEAEVGAGELTTTFDGVALPQKITVKVGAGKTTIVLPKSAEIIVNYNVGVGAVKISSAAKNINRTFGGLGASGKYQSASDSVPAIEINANVGAGEVDIVMQ